MPFSTEFLLSSSALDVLPCFTEAVSVADRFALRGDSNVYFLGREALMSTVSSIYKTGGLAAGNKPTSLVLALMMFAISSHGLLLSSSASTQIVQDHYRGNTDKGLGYFRAANSLCSYALAEANLDSLQCCLLMASYTRELSNPSVSSYYIGLAVRTVIILGLHHGPRKDHDVVSNEIGTRLFWATYLFDRYKPPCFRYYKLHPLTDTSQLSRMLGIPTMLPQSSCGRGLPQPNSEIDNATSSDLSELAYAVQLLLLSEKLLMER